jgi:TetR/AcrR family transcriptional regulator
MQKHSLPSTARPSAGARKRPQTRKARAEATRRRVLAAAEQKFATLGYAATRLEDVGAEAGVGRPAVLFHFADKLQLYRAVLEDVFGGLLAEVQLALGGVGSLPERMEAMFVAIVDYAGHRPTAAHLVLREAATTDPMMRDLVRAQAGAFLRLCAIVLDEGRRSGAWDPVADVYHFATIVAGAVVVYIAAMRTVVPDVPYDPLAPAQLAALKREVLAIARALLRPPKSPP